MKIRAQSHFQLKRLVIRLAIGAVTAGTMQWTIPSAQAASFKTYDECVEMITQSGYNTSVPSGVLKNPCNTDLFVPSKETTQVYSCVRGSGFDINRWQMKWAGTTSYENAVFASGGTSKAFTDESGIYHPGQYNCSAIAYRRVETKSYDYWVYPINHLIKEELYRTAVPAKNNPAYVDRYGIPTYWNFTQISQYSTYWRSLSNNVIVSNFYNEMKPDGTLDWISPYP